MPKRPSGTWLVLVRDVSQSVHVEDEDRLVAGLVLELESGMVRGAAVALGEREVLADVLAMAVGGHAPGQRPGVPAMLVCGAGLGSIVAEVLDALPGASPMPPIEEVEPPAEAEEIFDSLVGHLAGRSQPVDATGAADWALCYAEALRFYEAAPWRRWHDGIDLVLELSIGGESTTRAAVVMGNAGLQHGLVLYPCDATPEATRQSSAEDPVAPPAGSVLCTLDPPDELPADLRDKALRYGWPSGEEMLPAIWRVGRSGEAGRSGATDRSHSAGEPDGGDPDHDELRLLTIALAAVTAHDARGPLLVRPDGEPTRGEIDLADGEIGRFTLRPAPAEQELPAAGLRVHRVGHDLVAPGTPVVLGHLPWESLPQLRNDARIHRPFPPHSPQPAGTELPLVVVTATAHRGEALAAKVAELDPFGVSGFEADGTVLMSLVGANGAEALIELDPRGEAHRAFRRRLRETKGLHVVLVADAASATGDGAVYGLFECWQPLDPPRPRPPAAGTKRAGGSASPVRRRRKR